MAIYVDAEKDAASLAEMVNEDKLVTTRYGEQPKKSWMYMQNSFEGEIATAIFNLNKSRGFRVVGDFASGFDYELFNDVGIDSSGNAWIYTGAGAPIKTVPAATIPSEPDYQQVTFQSIAASSVSDSSGTSIQDFRDSFELKVFTSETDGLSLVQTYSNGSAQEYLVYNALNDTLATIYADSSGTTEIDQDGISNISSAAGTVVFYVDIGDYYVDIGGSNTYFTASNNNQVNFSYLSEGSSVFPKTGNLKVGDVIPSGVTHLLINGSVYKQVPTRAGTVNEIIDGQVLVGSVKCNMINEPLLNKSTPAAVIGKRLRDGVATKIACYGDSTMWGATVGDLETQNPNNAPAMLNEALKSIYGGGIVTYENRAKSGTTLRQMLSGGDGSGSTFAEKLQSGGLDNDANVIYCNHGTNDATQDNDIEQYVLDLETFISLCRAQDITPILVTPNPKTYLPSLVDEPKLKRLQHYVNTMRKVASDYNVDLVDQYELFTASNNQFKPNEIAPDGVHLSNGAYRQSGFNLAIPLVNCNSVGVDNKIAPLNSMSWFDNLSGREFQQQTTSLGGFVLKADRAALTGFNLPVVLSQGQDNIFVSGLRWSNGTVMDVALNKVATGQKLNFEAGAGSSSYLNYDSRARLEFRMYAGLQILGLTFDMSETGSNNQIAIGGLAIGDNSGAGITKITGTNSRGVRLNYWDQVIIPSFNFIAGGQKLELVDMGGNDAIQIYINAGQELKIDIIKDSVIESSTTIEAVFVDGSYPVNLSFDYDSIELTVNASFQSVSYAGIPELYIKTPNVIYDVVSVFP